MPDSGPACSKPVRLRARATTFYLDSMQSAICILRNNIVTSRTERTINYHFLTYYIDTVAPGGGLPEVLANFPSGVRRLPSGYS